MFCLGGFSKLVARCIDPFASFRDARVGLAPFGQDPSFNPSSVLFDAPAAAEVGLHYNTSPGSIEISALGNPFGFFPSANAVDAPFSIVFPVCFDSIFWFQMTCMYASQIKMASPSSLVSRRVHVCLHLYV